MFDFHYSKRLCTLVLSGKVEGLSATIKSLKKRLAEAKSPNEKSQLSQELASFTDQEEALKTLQKITSENVVMALNVFSGREEMLDAGEQVKQAIDTLEEIFSDAERLKIESQLRSLNRNLAKPLEIGIIDNKSSLYLNLKHYVARHFDFVMRAFPALNQLSAENKELIRVSFYTQLWRNQGWQCYGKYEGLELEAFLAPDIVMPTVLSSAAVDESEGNHPPPQLQP